MPDWLRRHLEASGHLSPDGVTRAARTTHCRRCGAVVMRGLDGDKAAFPATVDPEPLTALGEVLALLAGRGTYELRWVGHRYELDARDQWQIQGRPPAEIHAVAEHACGSGLTAAGYRPDDPTPPPTEYPDDPPF